MHLVNLSGKPDAGNPPVRFDEGDQGHLVPTLLLFFAFFVLNKVPNRPGERNPITLRQMTYTLT
jgi:hypothetical protein